MLHAVNFVLEALKRLFFFLTIFFPCLFVSGLYLNYFLIKLVQMVCYRFVVTVLIIYNLYLAKTPLFYPLSNFFCFVRIPEDNFDIT